MKSSWTGYNQFGKGIKRRLRFSKSGDKTIEDRYATHYIDKNRMNELKEKTLYFGVISGLTIFIILVANLFFTKIFTNYFSPSDFGVLKMILATLSSAKYIKKYLIWSF